MNAEYCTQIPQVKDWIHRCDARGEAHGAALAEAIGKTGIGPCAEAAEQYLGILENAGWIEPVRHAPTPTQRFARDEASRLKYRRAQVWRVTDLGAEAIRGAL